MLFCRVYKLNVLRSFESLNLKIFENEFDFKVVKKDFHHLLRAIHPIDLWPPPKCLSTLDDLMFRDSIFLCLTSLPKLCAISLVLPGKSLRTRMNTKNDKN